MALVKTGSPLLKLQHGWTVDEDENGLVTGECTWEGDFAYRGTAPQKGSLHPYDYRLTCYRTRLKRLGADKCQVTLSYIGLSSDPTPRMIEHPGGSGQEPIETHPYFVDFAGTAAAPLNGAYFDPESGEFVGFTDPESDLAGVRAYIVPSVMANVSYYSHYVPYLSNVGRIANFAPPNLYRPPNVRNWLLIGSPYRQIGNVFQTTLQLLGSGPNGWNRRIY